MPWLRAVLRSLYFGNDQRARRFRYGLICFDVATIAIFILAASASERWWIVPVDFALGVLLSLELAARLYATTNRRSQILSFATLTDIVVIGSLFLPALIDNLGFLRIVRALRLLRSYHLLHDLRSDSPWFRRYEDLVQRTLNLAVFIMIVTSLVYVTQHTYQPADHQLHRCPLLHHHDPDDHGLR